LTRTRISLGLLTVATGVAWATGGGAALRSEALALGTAVPLLLLLGGVAVLLQAVVPPGRLAGSALLVVIAIIGLSVRYDAWRSPTAKHALPIVLIVGGTVIAMSRRRKMPEIDTRIQRYWSPLAIPREKVTAVPHNLVVRVLPGHGVLDLSQAAYPVTADRVVADLTVMFGSLELVLPNDWQVLAGRVALTWAVGFAGELTDAAPAVPKVAATDRKKRLIVINIVGLGGRVSISRR
jgi:hypothetical protein